MATTEPPPKLTVVRNGIIYRLTSARGALKNKGVVDYLEDTVSLDDWNERVAEVRAANSGNLPSFWYKEFVKTGRLQLIKDTWAPSEFNGTFGKQFPANKVSA